MPTTAAGPFATGERVRLRAFDAEGVIEGVADTNTILAQGVGAPPEGEIRQVTRYEIRLDNCQVRIVADRHGHIEHV